VTSDAAPEFSRIFALNTLGSTPRNVRLIADADECSALARRFALLAMTRFEASARLVANSDSVDCEGSLIAEVAQPCAATGLPVHASVTSDFVVRFVPQCSDLNAPDEIEIHVEDCDIVEHDGNAIDLGEAAAQSLFLALDPFPRVPDAADTLKAAGVVGEDEVGNAAFAALKGLFKP
jgi:hypothetical protein